MRGIIIDVETYNLAEQAGMFCESLKDAMDGDTSPFNETKFIFAADEPYEIDFIWDSGDLRIKLCFMGDPDNSTWSVSEGKRKFRGTIGDDRDASAKLFLETIREFRK